MLNGSSAELRRVAIEPRGAQAQVGTGNRGTAFFFSGGLDSFYSVLTNLERLDALIFIHGFDAQLDDAETLGRVAPLVRKAAAGLGLPLVEVETDVKKVAKLYCRWGDQYHGALLASVAHVVSNRFERVLVPASAPAIRLHPWGSHPELDPLWGLRARGAQPRRCRHPGREDRRGQGLSGRPRQPSRVLQEGHRPAELR